MLTTFDLPLVSHVTTATRHKPFVGVLLKLDYNVIQQVCSELELVPSEDKRYSSLSIENIDYGICDALTRLVSLKDEPQLLPSISPLIEREIVIRLLNGPHGAHLLHLASSGSPSRQILSAVSWLKQHFSESIGMNELADRAHMSASNFRQRFKSLTGSSPLQYQKTLRLQEARDKMLLSGLDASQASSLVGCESPSQFSREYSRLFGLPPQKDIQRLRSS